MTTTSPRPPGPPIAPKSRMSLDKLITGKRVRSRRVLLYGPEGIGKSTFGLGSPKPVFITTEDGTDDLDAVRFPKPETWQDVLDSIATLTTSEHLFETLVLDTLDHAEPMLWASMMDKDNVGRPPSDRYERIEDYGYGKGYQNALESWRVFLAALERLRVAKGMNIIFLAHAWIKPFRNPEGDDFDRYELKLNPKAGGLLKEWCDEVFFAHYETYAYKDEKTKRVRGVATGARVISTTRTAAFDAKHRGNLPETLPLSWSDYEDAMKADAPVDPATLRNECLRKAKLIGGKIQEQAVDLVAKAGDDTTKLANIHNRLTARLAEKEG